MIRPVGNQPISFVDSLVRGCCTEEMPSYLATNDEVRFQVEYTQCGDAENLVSSQFSNWDYEPFTWRLNDAGACINENSTGSTISYPSFAPVEGTPYRLVFDAVNLIGLFRVTVGGLEFFISGDSGYDLFFIAQNTDPIEISPYTAESSGCLQNGVYIYELDGDFGIVIKDPEGATLWDADYAGDPGYFSFVNGGLNVAFPMAITNIDVGQCFTIEITDNCDETTLYSQQFKAVDPNDCTYIAIRACNDQDTSDFAVPFAPRIRIPASMSYPKFTHEVAEERYSNGRWMRSFADRQRELTVGTGILNEHDHNYLSGLPEWSHTYVEDQEVFVVADSYEVGYADVYSASGGVRFQVRPKQELFRNVQCVAERDGCDPANDPICNRPNVVFSWTDNELRAQLTSNAGFVVDTIRVQTADTDSGEQHWPGVPSSLYFGPFADGTPVEITITNLTDPLCVYTRDLTVPIFACAGVEGRLYVVVETGGTVSIPVDFDYRDNMGTTTNTGAGALSTTGAFCVIPEEAFTELNAQDVSALDFGGLVDLTSVNILLWVGDYLVLPAGPSLTTFSVQGGYTLIALDISQQPSITEFTATSNTFLTSILLGGQEFTYCVASNCALTAAVVDALCNACDASFAGGTLDLSGGTNAAPTAASLANRTALSGNGWTVTTN